MDAATSSSGPLLGNQLESIHVFLLLGESVAPLRTVSSRLIGPMSAVSRYLPLLISSLSTPAWALPPAPACKKQWRAHSSPRRTSLHARSWWTWRYGLARGRGPCRHLCCGKPLGQRDLLGREMDGQSTWNCNVGEIASEFVSDVVHEQFVRVAAPLTMRRSTGSTEGTHE